MVAPAKLQVSNKHHITGKAAIKQCSINVIPRKIGSEVNDLIILYVEYGPVYTEKHFSNEIFFCP